MPTYRKYFEDTYRFEDTAQVVSSTINDEAQVDVIVDETIFHPQGGGQPSDVGVMRNSQGETLLTIASLSVDANGDVVHRGTLAEGVAIEQLAAGTAVTMVVDEAARRAHARLHSAGHLLDAAMRDIGRTDLQPSKGNHFPDNPAVEYEGVVDAADREPLVAQLNDQISVLLERGGPVQVSYEDDEGNACDSRAAKAIRVLNIGGVSCPCGGTHVPNLEDLRPGIVVTKVKKKGSGVRVSYKMK